MSLVGLPKPGICSLFLGSLGLYNIGDPPLSGMSLF